MLCFYGSKGGVGCSVTAAATALASSGRQPTLLVDLHGDAPAILGADVEGPGLAEWFRAAEPPPDSLGRLEQRVTDRLSVLPLGSCRTVATADKYRLLAQLLQSDGRQVVADVGTLGIPAVALLGAAERAVLVTRACYLALRAASNGPTPDDVVVVLEPGRSFRSADVRSAVGAPVTVELQWDPSVARRVDAGIMARRFPRSLKALERLL